MQEQRAGDTLKLRVRREDREFSIEFLLGEVKESIYQIAEDSHASEKAKHVREGLLRGESRVAVAH